MPQLTQTEVEETIQSLKAVTRLAKVYGGGFALSSLVEGRSADGVFLLFEDALKAIYKNDNAIFNATDALMKMTSERDRLLFEVKNLTRKNKEYVAKMSQVASLASKMMIGVSTL